jgi:hypothetical protein
MGFPRIKLNLTMRNLVQFLVPILRVVSRFQQYYHYNEIGKTDKVISMKILGQALFVILICVAFNRGFAQGDSTLEHRLPFVGKPLFTETPEMGGKWRGGVRLTDLLCLDGYVNIADFFTFDVLFAGIPTIKDTANRQTISDRFILVSLKSRPLRFSLFNNEYAIAGGLKYHDEAFKILSTQDDDSFVVKSAWLVPFITQSYALGQRHHLNLFSSIALESRKLTTGNTLFASYCFVPGYRFDISSHWSAGADYCLFDASRLPMTIVWIAWSPSHLPFENINGDWFSYVFWGISYTGKHLRIDIDLANYYTFQGPVFPLISIGWNF